MGEKRSFVSYPRRKVSSTARTAKEKSVYQILEGLSLLKETATAVCRSSYIRLGIDPKYTDQQLRTTVALPKGTGQLSGWRWLQRRKVNEATNVVDVVGSEELINEDSKRHDDWSADCHTDMPAAKLWLLGPRVDAITGGTVTPNGHRTEDRRVQSW